MSRLTGLTQGLQSARAGMLSRRTNLIIHKIRRWEVLTPLTSSLADLNASGCGVD